MPTDSLLEERPVGRVADLPLSDRRHVVATVDDPPEGTVSASVVLVTYRSDRSEFESVLEAVDGQTAGDIEAVVVDNGTDWPVHRAVTAFDAVTAYVRLDRNRGVTTARNLGARVASSELVVFFDDDAVPARDCVEAHRRAHSGDVLGVRGRVLTTTDTFYNRRQTWYDLGDEVRPYHLNTEGNCSYDRATFLSAGGFDERLAGRAGHEGSDLTYRLVDSGHDRDSFVYHPDPVVYHDIDDSALSYLRKRISRRYHKRRLIERRPQLWDFVCSYERQATDDDRLDRRDRVLAYAFGAASRVGCTLRELRDRAAAVSVSGRESAE